jgi:hypothetical protein
VNGFLLRSPSGKLLARLRSNEKAARQNKAVPGMKARSEIDNRLNVVIS